MKRQPDERPWLWIIIEDEPGYRKLLGLIIDAFGSEKPFILQAAAKPCSGSKTSEKDGTMARYRNSSYLGMT
jgi:hypothetical protein